MKKSSLSLLLAVITMASVTNPMIHTVGAENSQFSDSFKFPVILLPSPPGSTVNAFGMITLNTTKDSAGTITAATGNIVIIFSGIPGTASVSRFNIREGLDGPPIEFGG